MFDSTNDFDYSQALCAQTDPELFFPEKGGSAEPAKRICNACPIKTECLVEALTKGYTDGIWGGLAPRERRSLKKVRVGNSRGRRNIPNVHKRST